MELNSRDKILTLKVVYYGTALGGKTTNLQTIHELTGRESRTEMITIATRDDRTLFFDLLPMGLGKFFGYELRLKLFTVPGQAQFDVTRRKVLAGADAVIFVADSQRSQALSNAAALKNLRVNLITNKLDVNTMPLVLQYNKRDLPDVMTIAELDTALNEKRVPSLPAVAPLGYGVLECLATAVAVVVERLVTLHRLGPPPEAKRAATQVAATLRSFAPDTPPVEQWERAVAASPAKAPEASEKERAWVHKADVAITDDVDVIEQAVEAHLALSEHVAGLTKSVSRLERRERQIDVLGKLARLAEEVGEASRLERELLGSTLEALSRSRGSLLVRQPSGGLVVLFLAGHRADPMAAIPSPPLGSLAERLIASGRALVTNDVLGEVFFGEARREAEGIFAFVFAPVRLRDGLFGGLFLYGEDPDEPFDAGDELFVEAACRIASLARLRVGGAAAAVEGAAGASSPERELHGSRA